MGIAVFLLFLAACGAAASTGTMFPPGEWYKALKKPSWTPPNWLFPVAWTLLYLAMAIAAARVALLPNNALAMGFWALQIALNTLWTPVFFGLHRIKAALVIIVLLWLAALGAMITLGQLDRLAGLLMMPYLAWLTYATALNAYIVQNNRNVVTEQP